MNTDGKIIVASVLGMASSLVNALFRAALVVILILIALKAFGVNVFGLVDIRHASIVKFIVITFAANYAFLLALLFYVKRLKKQEETEQAWRKLIDSVPRDKPPSRDS